MKLLNIFKFIILCFASAAMIFFAWYTSYDKEYEGLEVTFLDVGQGDCAYIKTPDNYRILIDSGDVGSYDKYIKGFIGGKRIKKLNAAVVSHYNSDHFYGVYEMLGNQNVDNIYVPYNAANSYLSDMLHKKCEYNNVNCVSVKAGDMIYNGKDGVKIYAIFPDERIYNNEADKSGNNDSVVIKLEYKDKKFLFMGDVEKEAEEVLVEYANLKADVLKVGHHGSDTSTTESFIAEVSPEYSVISCGINNQYGLPDGEIVDRIEKHGSKIYRTDKNGNITFTVDNNGDIKVKTSK